MNKLFDEEITITNDFDSTDWMSEFIDTLSRARYLREANAELIRRYDADELSDDDMLGIYEGIDEMQGNLECHRILRAGSISKLVRVACELFQSNRLSCRFSFSKEVFNTYKDAYEYVLDVVNVKEFDAGENNDYLSNAINGVIIYGTEEQNKMLDKVRENAEMIQRYKNDDESIYYACLYLCNLRNLLSSNNNLNNIFMRRS